MLYGQPIGSLPVLQSVSPVATGAVQATANTVGKQQLFGCAVHVCSSGWLSLVWLDQVIGWAAGNCTLQRLAGQSDDLVNLLLTAQNCKHGVPESDCFLLDVPVRPSFLPSG